MRENANNGFPQSDNDPGGMELPGIAAPKHYLEDCTIEINF
jgi:hypothetical protein